MLNKNNQTKKELNKLKNIILIMNLFNILPIFFLFASEVDFTPATEEATNILMANLPTIILIGIVLIIGTIFIIFFLKKIIVNSVLGLIFWGIIVYGLQIPLPFIPSLIISLILGPAGIGAMLILNALGILII